MYKILTIMILLIIITILILMIKKIKIKIVLILNKMNIKKFIIEGELILVIKKNLK